MMIYLGHVIDKMAVVYQRSFPVRSKKRVHCCVASELLLVFNSRFLDKEFSVELSNVYFTVIGQALQELWQFESRHANSRNLCAFLIHFIPDPVFWIMRV